VNDDIRILEAVERYITGEMSPDERVYFEQLRKSNPEVDQAVVEHTFFLQQLSRFDETRKIKGILNDTHVHLAEKGEISSPRLRGRARVVYLYNRYKRVSMIAASIAGITALTISALVWSFSPGKPASNQEVTQLMRDLDHKVNRIEQQNVALNEKIETVKDQNQNTPKAPVINYTGGGTGFLIDTKGYIVTNAHVVRDARHIAVQTGGSGDLTAEVVYSDVERDLAIIHITDKTYKAPASIPYAIRRSGGELAESIFTLGYPRNDIVYGNGYIAARTGYNDDTLTCQLAIPADRGNSGSPILNRNGEIIGVISNKQNTVEGAVFAIHSKYIFQAMAELQKDSAYRNLKMPAVSSIRNADRTQQVKKISEFVYMVKVD